MLYITSPNTPTWVRRGIALTGALPAPIRFSLPFALFGLAAASFFARTWFSNPLAHLAAWLITITASRVTGEPLAPWSASGWDGSRILPAGTGDYNGDGNADVATFYRHDGGAVDLNIWYGDGAGGLSLFRGWYASSGWEGNRMIAVK